MDVPETTDTPTMWQCKRGHTFAASYNQVEDGFTCPICRIEKLEDAIKLAREAIFTGQTVPENINYALKVLREEQ